MRRRHPFIPPLLIGGLLAGSLACGPKAAAEREREVAKATVIVEEGGASPFEGRLFFKSAEAMAIQEVPYAPTQEAETALWNAYARFRSQWTLQLTVGPKPSVPVTTLNAHDLDIENNGGMWRNFSRNLNRLMFEMKGFIRLRTKEGREIEPALVEYQRTFGLGRDRSFILVFPKVEEGKAVPAPFQVRVREFGQGTGLMTFDVKQGPSEMSWWRLKRLWKATARAEAQAGGGQGS